MDFIKSRVLRNSDSFLGVVVLVLSSVVWYLIEQIPPAKYRAISPTFFPYVLVTTMAILGLLLIAQGWRQSAGAILKVKITRIDAYRLAAFLAILWAYVKSVKALGFLVTSAIFVGIAELILGERRPHVILLLAVAVPTSLYVLFVKLLRVILPAGILG